MRESAYILYTFVAILRNLRVFFSLRKKVSQIYYDGFRFHYYYTHTHTELRTTTHNSLKKYERIIRLKLYALLYSEGNFKNEKINFKNS